MVIIVLDRDINTIFKKNIAGNFALFNYIIAIMVTKTSSIHNI